MRRRNGLRIAFLAVIAVSAASIGLGYLGYESQTATFEEPLQQPMDQRDSLAPPRDGPTVVTTQQEGDGETGAIIAFTADGRPWYYDNTYDSYYDVDPAGNTSVVYTATERLYTYCSPTERCSRSVVERLDLETGETERLYTRYAGSEGSTELHDVDLVGDDRLLVGDIAHDEVYMVDLSRDRRLWTWDAQHAFPIRSGGHFPSDWTHLNDVEQLQDGRVMVSVRNMDRAVFLTPGHGVWRNWTLGAEDDHAVLYEQHNPDYIPPEEGGPAVLVSDSENNRAVEYQRVDGSWEQTWTWRDNRLSWPRDVDRLPDGNSLVTDSNGDRLIEVDRGGDVVWTLPVEKPYEAERLGTGDESAGGASARQLGLSSREPGDTALSGAAASGQSVFVSAFRDAYGAVKDLVPGIILNGILFVLPPWIGVNQLPALFGLLVTPIVWLGAELYLSPRVRICSPLRIVSRGDEEG